MTSRSSTPKPGPALSQATTAPGALSTNDIARDTKKAIDTAHKAALARLVGGLGQGKGFHLKRRITTTANTTTKDADK